MPRNSVPPERAASFFGFVWSVIAVAAFVSARPLLSLPDELAQLPAAFWVMAALAVVSDARPFVPPGRWPSPAVFPSICFTFATLLAYGFAPAVVVQLVAVVVAGWRMRHALWRSVFNVAQYALAMAAAHGVLRLSAEGPFEFERRWSGVAVAAAAAAAWFAVNYGVVTTAIRLRFGGRWWALFRSGLAFELLSASSLLLLGPVLVAASRQSAALIPLILVPLYAVYRMVRLSAEQEAQSRIEPLTGLANRNALLTEVTEQADLHRERADKGLPDRHLALLLLDLDRFKHVNDALGHAVGDRLLVQVGHRLLAVVRPGDLVARLGGDEFAILASRLTGAEQARELADAVVAALVKPVRLDGLPLDVAGSIGIAVYPDHGEDFETLMRHADVAMYDAKQRGDTVAVYSAESDHNSPERLSLLGDLRRALGARDTGEQAGSDSPARLIGSDGPAQPAGWDGDQADGTGAAGYRERSTAGADGGRGEIALYYQPQIAIATGEVVGVEALLRWRHPRRGMVDPEELIRVAEQSAVMQLLTRRVIDDVLEQLAKWRAAGLRLRAALNVSVRDLLTGDIVDQIAERLTRYNVPAAQLQLEITEGDLMADPRRVLATIAKLDKLGVAIALDDFGTGYSSMQHLRRLPLSEVKVDRSFVLNMAGDTDDAAIVRSVIELAGALGLRVVAEGVEDERTWRMLHAAGCDVAQGWFYARPMPAEDLVAWLARYRPLRPDLLAQPAAPAPGGDSDPTGRRSTVATASPVVEENGQLTTTVGPPGLDEGAGDHRAVPDRATDSGGVGDRRPATDK